jgi:Zn-dependent protease
MLFGNNIDPVELIARLIVLAICFTVHEFAHAWTADMFGDDTPRQYGRLTLNPLAHLDPWGSIMLLIFRFGWAKPVPINPYVLGRRSPLAVMWVSLAGPFSNFLMAVLAAIPFRVMQISPGFAMFMENQSFLYTLLIDFLIINLSLMLFNLLPIAPLDGSKIAVAVLPESWGRVVEQTATYGPIILMAVIFLGPRVGIDLFGMVINPVMRNLLILLVGYGA